MNRENLYIRFMGLKKRFGMLEQKIQSTAGIVQNKMPITDREISLFNEMASNLLAYAEENHNSFMDDLKKVIADTNEFLKERK